MVAVAVAAFVAIAFLKVPFPLIVLARRWPGLRQLAQRAAAL